MDHKHIWKRSRRKHGRPGRYFCYCADPNCPDGPGEWQYTDNAPPFRTSVPRGGKSTVVSYRLKDWQKKILQEEDQTYTEFVDAAFSKAQRG